jgi:phage terminase large subunit-like protein
MARPRKSLLELVEDGSFLARQHHERLSEEPLRWKSLSKLQARYVAAATELERRQVAREFERATQQLQGRRARSAKPLVEHLEKLGPAGSAEQLKAFFPAFLKWENGSRFKLDPYQVLTIDLGWRRDKFGRRIFKEIGEGIPRGCGKTPFWSGIGTHQTLAGVGRPKVFQTSGGKEQAKLGIGYVSDWIDEDERLQSWLTKSSTRVTRRDGRGEYAIMAASGSLGHGRKPNIGLVDEFWTIETTAQEKTVTALETAVFKIDEAFWAWISTAGYSKDTLLGEAYETALKLPHVEHHDDGFHIRAWDEESGRLFLWWGLPDGYELDFENDAAMLEVIKKCNPATWLNHYELLRAMKRVRDREDKLNEWIRFNLNGWTKAKGSWFAAGVWIAIRSLAAFKEIDRPWLADPEIPKGSDIWVGVDAAKKRDTTCCSWATRLEDGRIALRGRVWSARDDVPHHVLVPGGRIRNSLVEDFIVNELGSRYRVREVVYDPRYFDTQGENLAEAGFTVAEFPQNSALMADALQHFYESAIEKTMTVPPDRVLAQQVAAAAAVLTESGWKVFKLKSSEPIDFVYSGSMARERCARATAKGAGTVYSKRGIRTL